MCLALAVSGAQRSVVSGRLRTLVQAGVWVGLAFQCKMVEAWAIVPVIGVTYLVAAPPRMLRRMLDVLVATLAMLAVSLSWVVMVALVPANSRPYSERTRRNARALQRAMADREEACRRLPASGQRTARLDVHSQVHVEFASVGGG
jgi:4-amino-4-deoxy-L-arabinose transferase-like glycosyltransferase